MQRVIWITLLAVFGVTTPALASPPLASNDAALSRSTGEIGSKSGSQYSLDLTVSLDYRSVDLEWEIPSIDLRLGELPPETLEIEIHLTSWLTLFILADLDAELPRLDSMDGDTYFAPGVQFHLTDTFTVYVEDFQAASGILGDESEEIVPDRSWDGHQLSVGGRWQVSERLQIEGAAVIYLLSKSHRPNALGARVSLTLEF